ncbi:MAG: SPFH domain-containing protein [Flavobacteriaceae bacterium]|nr:SPFH domain-containing protein [Flavobacteriaceae bacterium]
MNKFTKSIKLIGMGFVAVASFLVVLNGCSRVEPNYEGVLMENYGRNGKEDFKTVTGWQWTAWFGTTLYQVPMFETSGDPQEVQINAKDAGVFTVDPSYQYQPIRGRGVDIVFNYKHLGIDQPEVMMDNVENAILNKLVVNAYREEARNYTTDSLMNNLNAFEKQVEGRLKADFGNKYFQLNNLTSGLKPPASMARAIEERNNAIQQAERVKNELQVSKMNLEKAKIDAEANRIKSQGLDGKLLQEKWIEAIRNTNNKVIITDGKTSIMLQQ